MDHLIRHFAPVHHLLVVRTVSVHVVRAAGDNGHVSRGWLGEHGADRDSSHDPGRDTRRDSPSFIRVVDLTVDNAAIPTNTDEAFFTHRHRAASSDRNRALLTGNDSATGPTVVAAVDVRVPVDVDVVHVDVYVVVVPIHVRVVGAIGVCIRTPVVVVALSGSSTTRRAARLPRRTTALSLSPE